MIARVRLEVPLKLVLAGEYGVLEPQGLGVVAALDQRVVVEARKRPGGHVTLLGGFRLPKPDPSGELELGGLSADARAHFSFVLEALGRGYRYVAELGLEPEAIELSIDSSAGVLSVPGSDGAKLGLGTSAAVTVGALGALLSLHGVPIDRPSFRRALVRLALAAHHAAQGGIGSGIDVVAAVHGGLLCYRRGESTWLERRERRGLSALEIARGGWPGLSAEGLPVPRHMRLLCGYTGRSSATTGLVRGYLAWAKERPEAHARFVAASRRAAAGLAAALKSGLHRRILAALDAASEPLDELMRWSGLPIMTRKLRELVHLAREAGGAAKVSGAGGGDCGIAIAFDRKSAERILAAWRRADIVPIPLAIDPHGLDETLIVRAGGTRTP